MFNTNKTSSPRFGENSYRGCKLTEHSKWRSGCGPRKAYLVTYMEDSTQLEKAKEHNAFAQKFLLPSFSNEIYEDNPRRRIRKNTLARFSFLFVFLVVSCGWNFCLFFPHYGILLQQHVFGLMELSRTAKAKLIHNNSSGLVACISDRVSAAQAIVLAKSLQINWPDTFDEIPLELYHPGTLSHFLQSYLESIGNFVSVIDLFWIEREGNEAKSMPFAENNKSDNDYYHCLRQALEMTHLNHALVIPPALLALDESSSLSHFLSASQKQDAACGGYTGGTCASFLISEDARSFQKHLNGASLKGVLFTRTHDGADNSSPLTIVHNQTKQLVGFVQSIDQSTPKPSLMCLSSDFFLWASMNVFTEDTFVVQHQESRLNRSSTMSLERSLTTRLSQQWRNFWEARRLLLLDRPVHWVAFDGGLHPGATLNTLDAFQRSRGRAPIVNIDLAMTSDKKLVALHADTFFSPFDFHGNTLNKSVASMHSSEVMSSLTLPCIPQDLIQEWFFGKNDYCPHKCAKNFNAPIALASDFFDAMQDKESDETEIIFDLKSPTVELQLEQARVLAKQIAAGKSNISKRISVRFFSVFHDGDDLLAASVIPAEAMDALRSDGDLSELPYYINAPSSLACAQMTAWIKSHNTSSTNSTFKNQNIRGCYVIANHTGISTSWENLVAATDLPRNGNISSVDPTIICDVPRKQTHPDPSLWRNFYQQCLLDGFGYVHDPFPTAPIRVDHRHLQIPKYYNSDHVDGIVQRAVPEAFRDFAEVYRDKVTGYIKTTGMVTENVPVHLGYVAPSDWFGRKEWWFLGNRTHTPSRKDVEREVRHTRCITKVLTIFLFMRLQELEILSLDDLAINRSGIKRTWRHIFSNTGGTEPRNVGSIFKYNEQHWLPVRRAIEDHTGMNFMDAVRHYILDPMGLQGSFNDDTQFQPYTARGFEGPFDDLLVIGSTLASRGVSPKTGKQVLSASSVDMMLKNQLNSEKLRESFKKDRTYAEFRDHCNVFDGYFDKYGTVDGYGLGLWQVKGWRYDAQGDPMDGWIAVGSAFVYFDTTGMVLTFRSDSQSLAMMNAFARIIRAIGHRMLSAIPPAIAVTGQVDGQLI